MINPQPLDYIKQRLGQGATREQVKSELLNAGWQESDINQNLFDLKESSPYAQGGIPKFGNKKLLGIIMAAVIILGGGYLGVVYYKNSQTLDSGMQDVSSIKNSVQSNLPGMRQIFQRGSEVYKQLGGVYEKINSLELRGSINSLMLQSSIRSFSDNFTGQFIKPKTIRTMNSIHDVSLGVSPEGNRDDSYTLERIVTYGKTFEQTILGSKSYPWRVELIVDPVLEALAKRTGKPALTQRDYQFPTWLTLAYADDLKFEKQEGELYVYAIIPKKISYYDAVTLLKDSWRLQVNQDEAADISGVTGEVWINNDPQVVKEKYRIPSYTSQEARRDFPEQKDAGISIEMNYSYDTQFSIKQPIGTQAMDKNRDQVLKDLKTGKDLGQIEKEAKEREVANDPSIPIQERDNKRIADIRQIDGALTDYHYRGYYPDSLADILKDEFIPLDRTVLVASDPPDGSCTEQQNAYVYTKISKDSFIISFCLGKGWADLGPGIHHWTEKGLQ